MTQSKADSFVESITNTAVGFIIALFTWVFIAWLYGLQVTWHDNLSITGIFTVVSVIRQYILRRLFNGRSMWNALKGALN